MNPASGRSAVSRCAKRLRATDPRAFESFIEAFHGYAMEVTVAVTKVDQNEILNQQGRAQLALSLLELFRTCHQEDPNG